MALNKSLVFICTFFLHVQAKKKTKPGQPGFKYGGAQGDPSSSGLFTEGNVWVMVTIVASILAFLSMFCSPCCYRRCKRRKPVLCYLCHTHVPWGEWHDGSHRAKCGPDHQEFLNDLATPCEVFCPQCGQKLRLWPAQDHAPFKCHATDCPHAHTRGMLDNDGSNRFNCFLHDYDLCGECVMASNVDRMHKMEEQHQEDNQSYVDEKCEA